MKGLEINEVSLKEVLTENKSSRIDSTYFIKATLLMDKQLKANQHLFLKTKEVVSGPFGSTLHSTAYLEHGVPFVRVQNIKGGFEIQQNEIVYISEKNNELLKNSQLTVDDLVLSKVGNTIGYFARVDETLGRCNISENNIGIKLSSYPAEKRHYFLVFLNSKFGQQLTLRKISGNAQPKLNVSDLTEIPIPLMSNRLEVAVSSLVLLSRNLKYKSSDFFKKSEALLLETLSLTDFTPSSNPINQKSFKDSLCKSGRMDAEFYQPKYEDWRKAIQAYPKGCENLARVCEVKDKNFTPDDIETYSYIELSDIDKVGGITGATITEGLELPTRARRLVATGDVLISSIEGSLSSCALVSDKHNGALCSTGFYVIRSDKINSETLLVLMKSAPMQALLKQGCSGTILTAINNDAFLSLPIPLLDLALQKRIAVQVQESFKHKSESERLLEVAKRAVEIAIEQDESAGLRYIEQNLT